MSGIGSEYTCATSSEGDGSWLDEARSATTRRLAGCGAGTPLTVVARPTGPCWTTRGTTSTPAASWRSQREHRSPDPGSHQGLPPCCQRPAQGPLRPPHRQGSHPGEDGRGADHAASRRHRARGQGLLAGQDQRRPPGRHP